MTVAISTRATSQTSMGLGYEPSLFTEAMQNPVSTEIKYLISMFMWFHWVSYFSNGTNGFARQTANVLQPPPPLKLSKVYFFILLSSPISVLPI